MKIYLVAISCLFLLGCKQKQATRQENNNFKETKSSPVIAPISLEGVWAESEEDNALFKIKGDSIYDVDSEYIEGVYFEIKKDTMKIYYEEGEIGIHYILKKSSDSLIYKNVDDSVMSLYKR